MPFEYLQEPMKKNSLIEMFFVCVCLFVFLQSHSLIEKKTTKKET